MRIKKILSLFIISSLFLPLAAGNTDAKSFYKACQNTGIAGYYAFMSDTAFKMVKVVFQDSFKTASKTNKKESPVKKEQEKNTNIQAVITVQAHKVIKSANAKALYYIPSAATGGQILCGYPGASGGARESFWLIFLMILMILSVRKKDNCAIFASTGYFKHPVLF